jgi:hypothetical protein
MDGVRSPAPKLDESHEEPSTFKFIMFQINGIDAAEKVVVRRYVAASAHGRFRHSSAVEGCPPESGSARSLRLACRASMPIGCNSNK